VATTPWFTAAARVAEVMETAPGPEHACEGETSVMLAMVPELVRTARIEEAVRQAPAAVPARRGYSRFWSFSERAPITGTKGDPRAGTPAKGEKLLDIMAEELAEAVRDATLWRTPDPVWTPGRGQGPTAGDAEGR
jgi:creatinine amidohydrolase